MWKGHLHYAYKSSCMCHPSPWPPTQGRYWKVLQVISRSYRPAYVPIFLILLPLYQNLTTLIVPPRFHHHLHLPTHHLQLMLLIFLKMTTPFRCGTRVKICCDRYDQLSCKIYASCVNFPGNQCDVSHNLHRTTGFTHTKCDFALKL